MRKTVLVAGIVAIAVLAWWAVRTPWAPGSAPRQMRSLVWGGPKNISMLPLLAQHRGYFSEEGLDAKPNYVQTGKIAMDAVVSRDLQIGVIVDVNVGFVNFQDGANIHVIANVMDKFDDAIVARRDLGIENPQDLMGKTLAMLPGTTSHRYADLFIDFYKLDRQRITIVNLAPPAIQASLLSGQIPAGSVWQPFRYNIQKKLGEQVVQLHDRRIYRSRCLLGVRSDYAGDHGEELRAFLRALIKAEAFARDHQAEAIAVLAKELDIGVDVLTDVWDEYVLSVTLDDTLTQTFADTGAWIVRSQRGFEGRPVPSYADVVDASFLRDVSAERVTRAKD